MPSTRPTLTPALVHAAATDAGNRSMRAAGRTAWAVEDYHAAVAEYDRLSPRPTRTTRTGPPRADAGRCAHVDYYTINHAAGQHRCVDGCGYQFTDARRAAR